MFNPRRAQQRKEQQEADKKKQSEALEQKAESLINSIVKNAITERMEMYPLCVERGYGRTALEEAIEAAIIEAKKPYREIQFDDQKIRQLVTEAVKEIALSLGLDASLLHRSMIEQMLTNDLAAIEVSMFQYFEKNNHLSAVGPNLSAYITAMSAYIKDPKNTMPAFLDHDFMKLYAAGAKFRDVYNRLIQQEEAAKEKNKKPSGEQKDEPNQGKSNRA